MFFRVLMLLSLYAVSAHGQGFICGYDLSPEGASGQTSHSLRTGTHNVLVLFGNFQGAADPLPTGRTMATYRFTDRNNATNQTLSSDRLIDPALQGSLAHYFREMSNGTLNLTSINNAATRARWYIGTTQPTLPANCPVGDWRNAVEAFAQAVFIDAHDNHGVSFDNVDLVALLTPRFYGTGTDGRADDPCANGTFLGNIAWKPSDGIPRTNRVITGDWDHRFPFMVGILAHEYGHAIELPELFDRTNRLDPTAPSAEHSAGIGAWGVMGQGTLRLPSKPGKCS